MSDVKYSTRCLTRTNLPILTSGIAAVAMLIAEAATRNQADSATVADACYLLADLAGLVQEVAEREST